MLDELFQGRSSLDFTDPHAILLLLCVAQWVDLGYRDLHFFDNLTSDLPTLDRRTLPLLDYLKLRLAEGFRALSGEKLEPSIETFDLVLRLGDVLLPPYLAFVANFWKGRAHRKRGDYDQALVHITSARRLAEETGAPQLVAVTKIHESWLVFQRGERETAFRLLKEAEDVLRPTGHALSLGNIESARGRFVRRSGEYTRALAHFEAAIRIYSESFPTHPNLARALVNAAYVKRLIALDLQSKKDKSRGTGAVHAKALQISQEALSLLEQAGRIYAIHAHQGGTGSVLVNASHIHLESGDIDRAAIEGERAYELGHEQRDQILMSRAKIALAAVELARAEEQLGDNPDVAFHSNLAVEHAEAAVALALQTQNRRLLAEAYMTRGLAAADGYFQNWELAKEYATKGAALLSQDDRDHLYQVLGTLKAKLLDGARIDETLRQWSNGQLGSRTFQQIEEEFAEIIIPRVWINSGRNISKVAKDLKISPKKIRRILGHAEQRTKAPQNHAPTRGTTDKSSPRHGKG